MIIRHSFIKEDLEAEKFAKIAFGDIKVPRYVERTEGPMETAQRFMGGDFFLLNEMKSPDDAITIHMEPNGEFDTNELKATLDSSKDFLNYLEMVFNGYVSLAGSKPITKESAKDIKTRMVITQKPYNVVDPKTGKQAADCPAHCDSANIDIPELPLSDFEDILEYKENTAADGTKMEVFAGIIGQEDIMKSVQIIQRNNASIQKLTKDTKDAEKIYENLVKEVNDAQKVIIEIYKKVIDGFFNVIHKYMETDKHDDQLVDISFIYSLEVEVNPNEKKHFTDIVMYHHKALSYIQSLRGKFGIIE